MNAGLDNIKKSFFLCINPRSYCFFSILVVVSLFYGCQKKASTKSITIPEISKEYFIFRKGSYWIYQKADTTVTDSAFLTSDPLYSLDRNTDEDGSGITYETATILFSSKFIIGFLLDPSVVNFNGKQGGSELFFFPILSYYKTSSNAVYRTIAYYDSLLLNNHTFYNVYHTNCIIPFPSSDSVHYDYFFSRNVGLISYKQTKGSTTYSWSLLRWKVFQ